MQRNVVLLATLLVGSLACSSSPPGAAEEQMEDEGDDDSGHRPPDAAPRPRPDAAPPPMMQPDAGVPPMMQPDAAPMRSFERLSPDSLMLHEGEQVELAVRLTEGGRAVAESITFAAGASSRGATVPGSVRVGMDGTARATLRAGMASTFTVRATTERAEEIVFQVAVQSRYTATGRYRIETDGDLGEGFISTLGPRLGTIADLIDGANDPATYIIDRVLAEANNGTLSSAVNFFRPGLDAALNDYIISLAPELIGGLRRFGGELGRVARDLHFLSTFDVTEPAAAELTHDLAIRHTVTDVVFTDGSGGRRELPLSMAGVPNPVVDNVYGRIEDPAAMGVAGQPARMVIDLHRIDYPLEPVLRLALDQVILPELFPGAMSLGNVLTTFINCTSVGQWIATNVGVGSASMWGGLCTSALTAVGDVLENELTGWLASTSGTLVISGQAVVTDTDRNRSIDRLTDGKWAGSFNTPSQVHNLADQPGTLFSGTRQ